MKQLLTFLKSRQLASHGSDAVLRDKRSYERWPVVSFNVSMNIIISSISVKL